MGITQSAIINHDPKEAEMSQEDTLTTILRGYYYAVGILGNQQNDPLCCNCAAFARTAGAIIDSFFKFQDIHAAERKRLPEEFSMLFTDISDRIAVIEQPENPIRQKKTGNCKLPQGVCFTKEVSAFLQKIS